MAGSGIPKNPTVTMCNCGDDPFTVNRTSKLKLAGSAIPKNPTVTANGLPSDFRAPRGGAVRGQ